MSRPIRGESELHAVMGPHVPLEHVRTLLRSHRGNVQQAIAAHFDEHPQPSLASSHQPSSPTQVAESKSAPPSPPSASTGTAMQGRQETKIAPLQAASTTPLEKEPSASALPLEAAGARPSLELPQSTADAGGGRKRKASPSPPPAVLKRVALEATTVDAVAEETREEKLPTAPEQPAALFAPTASASPLTPRLLRCSASPSRSPLRATPPPAPSALAPPFTSSTPAHFDMNSAPSSLTIHAFPSAPPSLSPRPGPLPSLMPRASASAAKPFVKPAPLNSRATPATPAPAKTSVAKQQDGEHQPARPTQTEEKEERKRKRVEELKERLLSVLSADCCQPQSTSSLHRLLELRFPDSWTQPSHLRLALDELQRDGVLGSSSVQLPRGTSEVQEEDDWMLWVQPLLPPPTHPLQPTPASVPSPPPPPSATSYATPTAQRSKPITPALPSSFSTPPSSSPSSTNHLAGGPSSALKARLGARRGYSTQLLLSTSKPATPLTPSQLPAPLTPPSPPSTSSPVSSVIEQKRRSALHRLQAQPSRMERERAKLDSELRDACKTIERLQAERAKEVEASETQRVEQLQRKWLQATQLVLHDLLSSLRTARGEQLSMLAMMRGLGVDSDMVQWDAATEDFMPL